MPKNVFVNLPSFRSKKTYVFGGESYEVSFEPAPEGHGFVAYDVPDPVANHLLSGQFPAFSEYVKKGKPAPPPVPEAVGAPKEVPAPSRIKTKGKK